jgi:methyl-accepting chemotaxis protein
MISIKGLDYLKEVAELEADLIPGGVIYLAIEGDTFTWRKASKAFDLDIFQVGQKLNMGSIAGRAMKENRTIIENVPRSLYGMRLKTIAEPLVNEAGETVGVFSIVLPRLHPVAKAFNDFAPILTELFPEGAFMGVTDLNKMLNTQPSKKFDVPSLKVGDEFGEEFIAGRVIKSKKSVIEEVNTLEFGVPVRIASCPLFDEDTGDAVGSLGIITPMEVAANLRNMAGNLKDGILGISSAIEQLAASASQIHTNEQELNNEIKQVISLSEEINEVSAFIKEIADETKMLGLNAAIEAARAGEAGRGFGVVAEEIRKLSEQSKSTVPKIKKLTDSIMAKVDESSQKSQSSLASSQEQAAATEEITASIEEIASMTEVLNDIARKL